MLEKIVRIKSGEKLDASKTSYPKCLSFFMAMCETQNLALSSYRIGLHPFPDPFTHEANVKFKTLTQK